MEKFVKNLPKIELHAHLNGSLTTESLIELGELMYKETNRKEFVQLCENFKQIGDCSMSGCFEKFKFAHELTATLETLRKATLCVIRDFASDNVIYLELRTTPKSNSHMSKKDYLECVLEAIREARLIYPDITVKLLPSFNRSQGYFEAKETLDIVLHLLHEHADIIKAIDFSGDPTSGNFNEYRQLLETARSNNLMLALHCGEVENSQEVEAMIKFGMERCGHGTFIMKSNLNLLRDKLIPIECCLSSNVKCGSVQSYGSHHFKALFAEKHPVVICTDDFGIFDSNLSSELLIAAETFSLTQNDIIQLCFSAIDASFASPEEKIKLRHQVNEYANMIMYS